MCTVLQPQASACKRVSLTCRVRRCSSRAAARKIARATLAFHTHVSQSVSFPKWCTQQQTRALVPGDSCRSKQRQQAAASHHAAASSSAQTSTLFVVKRSAAVQGDGVRIICIQPPPPPPHTHACNCAAQQHNSQRDGECKCSGAGLLSVGGEGEGQAVGLVHAQVLRFVTAGMMRKCYSLSLQKGGGGRTACCPAPSPACWRRVQHSPRLQQWS